MSPKPPAPIDRPKSPRHKARAKSGAKPVAAKQPTLRDLTRQALAGEDLTALANELEGTSDRSAAIIAAAAVDRFLEEAILGRLVRNDEDTKANLIATGGALDGFFAKIHLGFALGLYSDKYVRELETIRKIRNCFAHSAKSITFDTSPIAAECNTLSARKYMGGNASNRKRYVAACQAAIMLLLIPKFVKVATGLTQKYKPQLDSLEGDIHNLEAAMRVLAGTADSIDIKILQEASSKPS
jgi:hypothetical protein